MYKLTHTNVCMHIHTFACMYEFTSSLCKYLKSYQYICMTDIPLSCFFPLPLALSDDSAKVITFKKAIMRRIHNNETVISYHNF